MQNLLKIYIITDDVYVQERYISLSINATDDFKISLEAKLKQLYAEEQFSYFYKIISENAQQKIDYLLSILKLDNNFYTYLYKNLSLHKDIRLLFIPSNYCKVKVIIKNQNKKNIVVVSINNDYTDLFFVKNNNIEDIKRIDFGSYHLRNALEENNFSDNQIKNFFNHDFSFALYRDNVNIVSVRMIVDKFINDLNYSIATYCSNNCLKIQELFLADNRYSKNELDTLLKTELKIPVNCYSEDGDVLIGGISVEEDMVLSTVKDLSMDEELFLPMPSKKKRLPKKPSLKHNISIPRTKTIQKFWLWFSIMAIFMLVLDVFLKYEKNMTYKELFRAKNQLNFSKNEYFRMLDRTQNINYRIENIKVIESERYIQKKLVGVLGWLYALRSDGMTINNVSYNRGLEYVEITGAVTNIKIINNYLERVNIKTKISDMVLSKMERIKDNKYEFVIGVRLK